MDVEIQKRFEKIERVIEEEDRLARIERRTIRIGTFFIVALTLLLIILSKLNDVVQVALLIWHALIG